MSHPWRASGAPVIKGTGWDVQRDGYISMRCHLCGRHSTKTEYGCCPTCLYNPHKATHVHGKLAYRIIHDPDGAFERNATFTKDDFVDTLKLGYWPDGLIVEFEGRVGKVTLGDDGKGRMTWYGGQG